MPSHVIARVVINEAGFPEYQFGANPYVHRSEGGAEQEARRLARKLDGEFAVFRKICNVGVVEERTSISLPAAWQGKTKNNPQSPS